MGVVMEKRRTIGVGVVSLGWMGRLHTRAYKALAEKFPEIDVNIRLVSCCDVVAENRRQAVDRLGFCTAVEDYHDLIGNPANINFWNFSHPSRGCSQENLVGTGGAGLFYCFAAK